MNCNCDQIFDILYATNIQDLRNRVAKHILWNFEINFVFRFLEEGFSNFSLFCYLRFHSLKMTPHVSYIFLIWTVSFLFDFLIYKFLTSFIFSNFSLLLFLLLRVYIFIFYFCFFIRLLLILTCIFNEFIIIYFVILFQVSNNLKYFCNGS